MADIESLLKEKRASSRRRRSRSRRTGARRKVAEYRRLGARSPERFWAQMAKQHVSWFTPWKKVLDWKPPFAKWFVGGKLNVSYNCLDRHLEGEHAWRRNKAALIWEGEPGDSRVLTYGGAPPRGVPLRERAEAASASRRATASPIYMPMIPELPIALLACTRIGATHSVVFGGFSAEALRDRVDDAGGQGRGHRRRRLPARRAARAEARRRRGAEGRRLRGARRGGAAHRPDRGDAARAATTGGTRSSRARERRLPAGDARRRAPALHPLHERHHGKPKGILHTTGGYLVQVATTTHAIFDLKDTDVYWCTADVGWVTGHSYVVYGPLANGATVFLYEGVPTQPGPGPLVGDDRALGHLDPLHRADGDPHLRAARRGASAIAHDLSSLRLLGSVGEPINPEAWMWYHRVIGGKRCPIVDTWWQTETGGIMITPLPGETATVPGSATLPVPGHRRRGDRRGGQDREAARTAASSRSGGPGRACCAASAATRSATARPTGASGATSTSRATARIATRAATSGSWAASTT